MNFKKLLFTFFYLICISNYAATITVNSQSTFNSALSSASAGDIIEWEDGTYSDIFMDVEINDITIKAVNDGEVTFTGNSYVELHGDNINFQGFQYLNGNVGTRNIIRVYGSYINISDINIKDYTSYKYLIVETSSQYTTIEYCNFEHRVNYADQNILSLLVNSAQPGYHKVAYCSFKNFDGTGGDLGVEPIRIGVSTQANFNSRSIVEYCYFTQCNGDGEIISHKASQCVYRYNTFDDNPYGELVLRHGNEGIVYGNFFTNNMGGVRIREGQNHKVFNNYFTNLDDSSIELQASSGDLRLEDIIIAYNTIVNSGPVQLNDDGNSPINTTLANNIFANPTGDLFESNNGDENWINNIVYGTTGIGTPAGSITSDPNLSLNSEGFYEIGSSSPAVDSGSTISSFTTYTGMDYDHNILYDIIETTRPSSHASKDIGCQEYNASATVMAHASAENTGPRYFMEEISTTSFSVTPTTISVNGLASSETLSISTESDTNWTTSISDSWISLDSNTGTGSSDIILSISDNTSGSDSRSGSVTLSPDNGEADVIISIIQTTDAYTPSEITIVNATAIGTQADRVTVSPDFAWDDEVSETNYWTGDASLEDVEITFDLNCIRTIDEIGIHFLKADERQTYFSIIASEDGITYFDVLIDESSAASGATVATEQIFDLNGINAQYVTIIGQGNSAGSGWSSISEVSFYGNADTCLVLSNDTFKTKLSDEGVNVYPIPSYDGNIFIQANETLNSEIKIYNINGAEVYSSYINQVNLKKIDVSELPKGLYFLTINGKGSQKIILN